MMFRRPGQTCSAWLQELTQVYVFLDRTSTVFVPCPSGLHSIYHIVTFRQVLEVCDNHLSLYQLTVEPGTPLAKSVTTGTLVIHSYAYASRSVWCRNFNMLYVYIQVLPEPDIVADMYEAAIQVSFSNYGNSFRSIRLHSHMTTGT